VNTKYFQFLVNRRHRKTCIFQLQDGSRNITEDNKLKKCITSYYKNLFGPPQDNTMRIDERRRDDIPQVT
jgi:hypothetical protein